MQAKIYFIGKKNVFFSVSSRTKDLLWPISHARIEVRVLIYVVRIRKYLRHEDFENKNELLIRPVSSSVPIPLALPGVVVGVVTVPAPPVPDLLTALHLTTIK